MQFEILVDCIILTFLSITLLLSISILIIVSISIRPFTTNVPILLTFNTYLSLTLTCVTMSIIYIYNLYGDLHSFVSVKDHWCQLRTYFVNVCFCSLYYSCVLQSIFRLFRVVFYKKKLLQSKQFFIIAIILQWFLSFILTLSNLFNDDYQHLPFLYRCWISFLNTRGLLLAALIIYGWPLITIVSIYTYIVRYIHQTNQIQRKKTIKRDLLILKRITIFVLVITGIGLPTILILFILMATNKLIPMAYHIQGLSMAFGVFIASIGFAFITPQILEIFNRKQKKHRSILIRRD
ncbi:unnamed protein product [Adineta steineri]|uniref:G-protein coupled receptors family 1 profile domain-containing protein n=1 Tax=Adineta steineri TaxID=433720 RepID=A0A815MDD6_9BILA|nr:unnamed protein product [Adineta steineri]CAF3740960.1 unnamed protein product [Adineta steineri]